MTESIIETANHPIYQRSTKEEADGCAWVFYNKSIFDKYYYKLPILEDNHVRVRNLYAGLCFSDVLSGRDKWGYQLSPLCAGHEVLSEIVAVGKNVTKFKVGDKVLFGPFRDCCNNCEFCKEGNTNLCQVTSSEELCLYGLYFGGYCTHMQQPENLCFRFPENMDEKTVAPIMCAGITVFNPMKRCLKKGDKIAVLGVGGLGHLAVQIGVKMGMTVDAFCSGMSKDKEEFVKSLGTNQVHYWKNKGVLENLRNQYDGIIYTIPVAVDSNFMDKFLDTLKPRGHMMIVGAPPIEQKMIFSFFSILTKEIFIVGSNVGGKKDTQEMLDFFSEHKIVSLCEQFEFEDFPKALDKLENGSPKFRCVVDVGKFAKEFNKK